MTTALTTPSLRPAGGVGSLPHPAGASPAARGTPTRHSGSPAGTHPHGGADRRPTRQRPEPSRRCRSLGDLATGFVRLYLEVEAGRRRATQLAPLMDSRLYAQLEPHWVRRGGQRRLVRVWGTRTSADCYDAVALVQGGGRTGALALRLARRNGRWLVAEATRPEDGHLPVPTMWMPAAEPDSFDLFGVGAAR